MYAVSPGHNKSPKAVLLKMDQNTMSSGFVEFVGAARKVTLLAVSNADPFNEWANRNGHLSCDCEKKACLAPVGSEFVMLASLRKAEEKMRASKLPPAAGGAKAIGAKGKGGRRVLLKKGKGAAATTAAKTVASSNPAPDSCEDATPTFA